MKPAAVPVPCYTGHAFERAQERYGVTLLAEDMTAILAACLGGDAPVIRHNSWTDIHIVMHKGIRFVVAVRLRRLIITFMPPDADRTDPRFRDKPRAGDSDGKHPKPYKRSKFRLADMRRGDFEEASA